MRYKPERALTPDRNVNSVYSITTVEMRYKPERALTPANDSAARISLPCRNEV